MPFKFFDPRADVLVSRASLPHWEQAGATYFITFRTADSIPKAVLAQWTAERAVWLQQHEIDSTSDDWHAELELLPEPARREFTRRFSQKWHDELDRSHGACLLRRPDAAKIVADSLRHFDSMRYDLGDFVVMPNHVHLLAGIAGRAAMRRLCYSWKKFTATQINRQLKRQGEFWQTESFDHLVRSVESFAKFRQYIADNPVKAGLRETEYFYTKVAAALRDASPA